MERGLAWVALIAMPLMLTCGLAEYAAAQYARGTRGRYVLRSIERSLRGAVAIFLVAATAFALVRGQWGSACISVLLIIGFVMHWGKIDDEDDDDFWRTCVGKIRSWVRSRPVAGVSTQS